MESTDKKKLITKKKNIQNKQFKSKFRIEKKTMHGGPNMQCKSEFLKDHELKNILGSNEEKNEEKALEQFIFGCDADELESSSDSHSEEEMVEDTHEVEKPAWVDEEDECTLVEEKARSLKNCHRSISCRGSEKLSEYAQEEFKKIVGDPEWAKIKRQENPDDDNELLRTTGNFILPSKYLPAGVIQIQRCPCLIDESLNKTVVTSLEFHPSARVAVAAALSGTACIFQIDGKTNAKIQSISFEKFPIRTAHFTLSGNEIIVGSHVRADYYSYDMLSGKIIRIPWNKAMEQRNISKFHMSPDGKYIVIQGRYGHIHLVTVNSKEWVGSLKMNGEVIAITFNKDGSKMFSHGNTGEVYIWDMNTRRCIHKFVDEGCVTGTSLAISPNNQFLAAGSDCGVVNIYDNNTLCETKSPKPVKVLMNLTTQVSHLKFNCTSELLAMNSERKQNSVKLVQFPSMTVFSNFPVTNDISKINFVNALDISVNSGYLGLGNNTSTVRIFRLKHYHNY